jgi:hypothetical protein
MDDSSARTVALQDAETSSALLLEKRFALKREFISFVGPKEKGLPRRS